MRVVNEWQVISVLRRSDVLPTKACCPPLHSKGWQFPAGVHIGLVRWHVAWVQGVLLPFPWLWVGLRDMVKITNSLSGEQESPFHKNGQKIHSSLSHHTSSSGHANLCFLVFSVNELSEDSLGLKVENGNWVSHLCPRKRVPLPIERSQWSSPVTSSLRKLHKKQDRICRGEGKALFF